MSKTERLEQRIKLLQRTQSNEEVSYLLNLENQLFEGDK